MTTPLAPDSAASMPTSTWSLADRAERLIGALVDVQRRLSRLQAEESTLLSAAVDLARELDAASPSGSAHDIPLRSLAAQIAAALRASDRTVQRRMSEAWELTERFPATWAALAAGEITRGHVAVIVEAGSAIDVPAVRTDLEGAALAVARRESPGRLRPAARLLAARLHPVPLADRHLRAAARRDVVVRDFDDGMAELIATLPAAIAHGIRDRLDRLARTTLDARRDESAQPGSDGRDGHSDSGDADGELPMTMTTTAVRRRPADRRGIGAVRADTFADLLLTGHASATVSGASVPEAEAIRAHVQITVPALTAMGAVPGAVIDNAEAQCQGGAAAFGAALATLAGRQPIDTATALRLAATAPGWDRVLTHPITDAVVAVDRYRPSDEMRRTLRVRDEHCRFPGCRQPVRRCDIDHTVAREHDGPTALANLAHLCRRHHTLKHHSAWRVRQTSDGVLHWTSPTGRPYPDVPARTLTFTAGDADAPPDLNDPPDRVPSGRSAPDDKGDGGAPF